MKAFKDFMEALTLQQRRKRSIISKKKAKVTAIKRKRSMRKPPSQDKIDKAVNKVAVLVKLLNLLAVISAAIAPTKADKIQHPPKV